MTPRLVPRDVPIGPRYWMVDVPGKGEHHFRFPGYGVAARVSRLLALKARSGGEAPTQADIIDMLPHMMAAVGACWWNRGLALGATWPADPTVEALLAFGEAVSDELLEGGYDLLAQLALFNAVMPEVNGRQNLATMAQARADFMQPPGDASTTSA